jgi:hypothetical protein
MNLNNLRGSLVKLKKISCREQVLCVQNGPETVLMMREASKMGFARISRQMTAVSWEDKQTANFSGTACQK